VCSREYDTHKEYPPGRDLAESNEERGEQPNTWESEVRPNMRRPGPIGLMCSPTEQVEEELSDRDECVDPDGKRNCQSETPSHWPTKTKN
jgi:hypothetical protein